MSYLIVYWFKHKSSSVGSFHNDVADSISGFIEDVEKFDDGEYKLVNAISVSDEEAERLKEIVS